MSSGVVKKCLPPRKGECFFNGFQRIPDCFESVANRFFIQRQVMVVAKHPVNGLGNGLLVNSIDSDGVEKLLPMIGQFTQSGFGFYEPLSLLEATFLVADVRHDSFAFGSYRFLERLDQFGCGAP